MNCVLKIWTKIFTLREMILNSKNFLNQRFSSKKWIVKICIYWDSTENWIWIEMNSGYLCEYTIKPDKNKEFYFIHHFASSIWIWNNMLHLLNVECARKSFKRSFFVELLQMNVYTIFHMNFWNWYTFTMHANSKWYGHRKKH